MKSAQEKARILKTLKARARALAQPPAQEQDANTLEIVEFMTAAQLSKERNGAEVRLDELRK